MQFVFITAEGDGVFKVHLFTRLRQLIRRPVSDDVIVGFIVGWNFYQLNAAFTPLLSESPMRLDEDRNDHRDLQSGRNHDRAATDRSLAGFP